MDQALVKDVTSKGIDKTAIKDFAVSARNKLMNDIKNKAAMIGVTESGIQEPLSSSTGNIQLFDIGMQEPYRIEGKAIQQRNGLIRELKKRTEGSTYLIAYETLIEEVAYTWFNRIIAIRFMEVNNYMPDRMRVLSSGVEGVNEPEFITHVLETNFDFSEEEKEWIIELRTDGSNLAMDELFQYLFIKQCNTLNANLPELFETTNDYTELLLTVSYNDVEGVIYKLVHDVPEDNFDVNSDSGNGQVEIIGWLYQYYNTEPKIEVDKAVKSKKKVNKYQLPAKTQIFTPDWVVKYMVENSLGRLWIEKLQAGGDRRTDKDIASEFGWKYYLPEAEQNIKVKRDLVEIRKDRSDIHLENITFIDPAMGSFHIGVYAFKVFMQLYTSEGYTKREAVRSIIENNLYGLDIDKRASQLSYFACVMQARKHNRQMLDGGIHPNVYEISESNDINIEHLNYMGNNIEDKGVWNNQKEQIVSLLYKFHDAKEFGSLIDISSKYEFDKLKDFVLSSKFAAQISLFDTLGLEETQCFLINILNVAQILSQEYDVIITNPPYLGSSAMNAKLVKFGKKYYPNSKLDLFAMFIESWNRRVKFNGCNAMVTMQSWMFLSSYENMRNNILTKYTISNLMLMENMVMGIAFGTVATLFWNRPNNGYTGTYNYVEYKHVKDNEPSIFPNKNHRFAYLNQENLKKIPGSPIAYWIGKDTLSTFDLDSLASVSEPRMGLTSGNNEHYLRMWHEVDFFSIGLRMNREDAKNSGLKWFPFNKGGDFRKWYGNRTFIVNWYNDGYEMRTKKHPTVDRIWAHNFNQEYNFRKHLTWNDITSGSLSFRAFESGFLFDSAAAVAFVDDSVYYYLLGYLNTKQVNEISKLLNPTIHFLLGDFIKIPNIYDKEKALNIESLVRENLSISKSEWDSFETSWDFETHPFITWKSEANTISKSFETWSQTAEERFNQLKANEEELNRIFIDIYNLQEEFTPEVEDKDVTVRKADLQREVKSFLSYLVGVIFGRYSLDEKGLVFAGSEFNARKYKNYQPNTDNFILLSQEHYFNDGIVTKIEELISIIYGEPSNEENLQFIAEVLGMRGNEISRDTIRRYFINDFYKDHTQAYKKRPIYWLYDSGKQNGFKALVYMHRYDEDTTGKGRVDYLHQVQRAYERTIANLQEDIANSKDAKETSQLQKQLEKLTKQLKECRDYDERLGHMALERVPIDLDDGVKVNYEKVQTDSKGRFHQILAKIK